jgi:hypothetical protein
VQALLSPDEQGKRVDIQLKPFAEQVDAYLSGEFVRGRSLWLGRTPASLRMLGFPDLPLRMAPGVLFKIHTGKGGDRPGVPAHTIARLPELIDEPGAIFDSATVTGALVVLTAVTTEHGTLVTSVEADCRDANAVVNMVTSGYYKDRETWPAEQVAKVLLRYADKKKGFGIPEASGLTLNRETEPGSQNPSSATILLPDDLSNYRAEQRAIRLSSLKTP